MNMYCNLISQRKNKHNSDKNNSYLPILKSNSCRTSTASLVRWSGGHRLLQALAIALKYKIRYLKSSSLIQSFKWKCHTKQHFFSLLLQKIHSQISNCLILTYSRLLYGYHFYKLLNISIFLSHKYCFTTKMYQNKAVARGVATGACAPPFSNKKPKKTHYFLCTIIRFDTNNPKCQYVYLSFYLNDYQIIDKVNTI